MTKDKKRSKTEEDLLRRLGETTEDLQRTRADFENYRKRVDAEKAAARITGETSATMRLIPVIDNIERAINHVPDDLIDNDWVKGVVALRKNLETALAQLKIAKIDTTPGVKFDPNLHDAIQFDEDSVGDVEVIESELQPGYTVNGEPIRHAMVRVTRR